MVFDPTAFDCTGIGISEIPSHYLAASNNGAGCDNFICHQCGFFVGVSSQSKYRLLFVSLWTAHWKLNGRLNFCKKALIQNLCRTMKRLTPMLILIIKVGGEVHQGWLSELVSCNWFVALRFAMKDISHYKYNSWADHCLEFPAGQDIMSHAFMSPAWIPAVQSCINRRLPERSISLSVGLVVGGCIIAGAGDFAFDLKG